MICFTNDTVASRTWLTAPGCSLNSRAQCILLCAWCASHHKTSCRNLLISRLAGARDNMCDSSTSDSIFYQITLNWDTRGHSPALRYNGPSLPAMCVAVASLNPTCYRLMSVRPIREYISSSGGGTLVTTASRFWRNIRPLYRKVCQHYFPHRCEPCWFSIGFSSQADIEQLVSITEPALDFIAAKASSSTPTPSQLTNTAAGAKGVSDEDKHSCFL